MKRRTEFGKRSDEEEEHGLLLDTPLLLCLVLLVWNNVLSSARTFSSCLMKKRKRRELDQERNKELFDYQGKKFKISVGFFITMESIGSSTIL